MKRVISDYSCACGTQAYTALAVVCFAAMAASEAGDFTLHKKAASASQDYGQRMVHQELVHNVAF